MGGREHLKAAMKRLATNIALQVMKKKTSRPKTAKQLDLFAEQAFMCGIYGIVECTSARIAEKLLRYVNPTTGCSNLSYYKRHKHHYNGKKDTTITGDDVDGDDGRAGRQKRADVLLGMYKMMIDWKDRLDEKYMFKNLTNLILLLLI